MLSLEYRHTHAGIQDGIRPLANRYQDQVKDVRMFSPSYTIIIIVILLREHKLYNYLD